VGYRILPGALEILHTEVPRELEGRGLASRIAALVIGEVRRRRLRLIPLCPFFGAYLKKHPEHADLLDPAYGPSANSN
jgi:predicted GNAT family acetyltransferase